MNTKGIYSSEFWLTVASALLAAFTNSGLFPATHWSIKLAAVITAGITTALYSLSRGLAKAGSGGVTNVGSGSVTTAEPKVPPTSGVIGVLVLGLALGASGCAGWQQTAKTALDSAGAMARTARAVGEPYYAQKCEAVARSCAAAKTPSCPALTACQESRHRILVLPLVAIHTARVGGYGAIAAGQEKTALGVVARVGVMVCDAQRALQVAGVIP